MTRCALSSTCLSGQEWEPDNHDDEIQEYITRTNREYARKPGARSTMRMGRNDLVAPELVGTTPAEAQNLKMAQGVDIQIGRDRDRRRNDSDATLGIGPGGLTVGPRQNCRMVTTTIERDGRTIPRKERRCD